MEINEYVFSLAPIIIGLVAVVKTANYVPRNLLPLITVAMSVVVCVATGFSWLDGLALGLASCGLYDNIKHPIKLIRDN